MRLARERLQKFKTHFKNVVTFEDSTDFEDRYEGKVYNWGLKVRTYTDVLRFIDFLCFQIPPEKFDTLVVKEDLDIEECPGGWLVSGKLGAQRADESFYSPPKDEFIKILK
jgi:hypothetical protein